MRIMVGMLYMEHGLAKTPDFPHQPNHAPYAPFTLNTGLQGLLELVDGLLLALGLFTRPLPFVLAGDMGGRLFHGARAERCLPAAQRGELAIVHSFVFLYFWVAGGGEWSLDRICKPASTSAVSPSPA
jgi:putative oxidoreductase